jgi:hypothetical protein
LTETRRYHISIHPKMILMLHRERGEPFRKLIEGLEDNITDLDIEIQLLQDLRDGRVYTIGECDNKDERGACQGHPPRQTPSDATAITKQEEVKE